MWVEEAKTVMHLYNSSITVRYKPKSKDKDCFADIETDHRYLSGKITIFEEDFAELWDTFGAPECKQTIFHEIAHVLVCPLLVLRLQFLRVLCPSGVGLRFKSRSEHFTPFILLLIVFKLQINHLTPFEPH